MKPVAEAVVTTLSPLSHVGIHNVPSMSQLSAQLFVAQSEAGLKGMMILDLLHLISAVHEDVASVVQIAMEVCIFPNRSDH